MKIRLDYVTNSSSSSYVIAFKESQNFDEETLKKYTFLSGWNEMFKEMLFGNDGAEETNEGITVENITDLQQYLMDEYSLSYHNGSFENLLNDDEYINDIYIKCKEYLSKGFKIHFKNIDYDDSRSGIFKKIESDNFVIIEGDD